MLRTLSILCRNKAVFLSVAQRNVLNYKSNRGISKSKHLFDKNEVTKSLALIDAFANAQQKDKETYIEMVKIFESRDVHRRGHVEFITTALKYMEDFGVHKDLDAYKALINVLPKGKFIPTNIFQSEFMHYPKQQQCAIDVLEQMEDNGVIPDYELEDILLNIFGNRGHPLRKFWRMMYWMPKFKNLSPWPIPNPPPNDALELAKLALERMSSVDLQSTITEYQTSTVADSIDKTWVVSAQSPTQRDLLKHRSKQLPVFVEGPFRLWLRSAAVNYFVLKGDALPKPKPIEEDLDDVSSIKMPFYEMPKQVVVKESVHEQDDGVIFAMCATGTSSHDSLLSWIRLLEQDRNPVLANVPVVFRLKQLTKEIVKSETQVDEEKKLA